MVCPQCGAQIPEGESVCPACGYDTQAVSPVTADPVAAAPDARADSPSGPAMAPADPPSKNRKWLYIGIGVIVALALVGLVALGYSVLVPGFAKNTSSSGAIQPSVETTAQAGTGTAASDDAAVKAGEQTVSDFYAAMNAGDLPKLQAAFVPDVRADIDAGMFEEWTKTTFEYTRGWVDGTTVYIVGRESQAQFGSGDNGGVKFALEQADGKWLVADFWSVDTTQVEGSDTTGSSAGLPGKLTEATAKELMNQVLAARKTGAGNTIRRLATETFLLDNEVDWLSGLDNTDYFTKYTIDSVKITGASATVVVTETWTDGTFPSTYGLVEQNGAVLLDSWEPQ
jgi:hypothetical protein